MKCINAILQFKQFFESEEEDWLDEPPKTYRPGELMDDGEYYYPDAEPDYDEFMSNYYKTDFGEVGDQITPASGWILRNGSTVPMGGMQRDQDHRNIVPHSGIMTKWGYPSEIVKKFDQGSSTPAMYELMRRSGVIRITAANKEHFAIQGFQSPTPAQRRTITRFVKQYQPQSVALEFPDINTVLSMPMPSEIMNLLN